MQNQGSEQLNWSALKPAAVADIEHLSSLNRLLVEFGSALDWYPEGWRGTYLRTNQLSWYHQRPRGRLIMSELLGGDWYGYGFYESEAFLHSEPHAHLSTVLPAHSWRQGPTQLPPSADIPYPKLNDWESSSLNVVHKRVEHTNEWNTPKSHTNDTFQSPCKNSHLSIKSYKISPEYFTYDFKCNVGFLELPTNYLER